MSLIYLFLAVSFHFMLLSIVGQPDDYLVFWHYDLFPKCVCIITAHLALALLTSNYC